MKIKTVKTILLFSLISLPVLALAAYGTPVPQPPEVGITTMGEIIAILNSVVNWMFAILLIIAVIFILLAAFAYLGSAGDAEKVKTAQNRLIYAAVAIGIGLIAKGVGWFVYNFLSTRGG